MLDVMAAYDPDDSIPAFGRRQKPHSYASSLDRDGLRGARIGLVTDLMGTEAVHEEVNVAVHNAVQLMEQLGAAVLRIAIPRLTILTTDLAMGRFEFREAFNRYLARLGPDAPVKNLAEFLAVCGGTCPLRPLCQVTGFASSRSMLSTSCADSGATCARKRATTVPSRSSRNFSKFH
jgi:Asp-tRNA(Asn)/Glu-tRNA(Gln) amidotransferase A subunit family amidase